VLVRLKMQLSYASESCKVIVNSNWAVCLVTAAVMVHTVQLASGARSIRYYLVK